MKAVGIIVALGFAVGAVTPAGCASARNLEGRPDLASPGSAADFSALGPTLDQSVATSDGAVAHGDAATLPKMDAAMPTAGDMAATCTAFTPPPVCATSNGLSVYCIAPGQTLAFQAAVTIATNDSFVALGPGSVSNGTNIGYFTSTDPFTCSAVQCAGETGTQNAAGGKICDVIFQTGAPTTVTATGLFGITPASNAAAGDYEIAYVSQAPITTPSFYLRIAP